MDQPFSNDQILEALKKSGFILEGKVSRILQEFGWEVEHSYPYYDRNAEKKREIDIVGTQSREIGSGVMLLRMKAIVECKKRSLGIVVMGRKQRFKADRSVLYYLCRGYPNDVQFEKEVIYPGVYLDLPSVLPHFNIDRVGYQILGIDGSDPRKPRKVDSIINEFLEPLNKATHSIADYGRSIFDRNSFDNMVWEIYFPVLVTTGPIWFYDTQQSDIDAKLEQVPTAVLSLPDNSSFGGIDSGVPLLVMDESSLATVFEDAQRVLDASTSVLESNLEEIRRSQWNRMSDDERQTVLRRRDDDGLRTGR